MGCGTRRSGFARKEGRANPHCPEHCGQHHLQFPGNVPIYCLKERFSAGWSSTMSHRNGRAARFRHTSILVILSLASATLVPAATDTAFTPSALSFKYQIGAALPAAQVLQIKSTGTALSFTVSLTGSAPYLAQWLSVSANSGTTPVSLKVYVNPTGLPAGSYAATIAVSAPAAATPSKTVAVTLDVGDPAAKLSASVPRWYSGSRAAPRCRPRNPWC